MKAKRIIQVGLVLAVAVSAIALWHRHRSSVGQTAVEPAPAKAAPLAQAGRNQANPAAVLPPAHISIETSPASLAQTIANEGADYQQRADAIQALSGKLSDTDREILYAFLRQHLSGDQRQNGEVLRNQLMDALTGMQPPLAGLRELLTEIYQDSGQDMVLRDYAVQHLAQFYRQMAATPASDASYQADELKQAQAVLWEAVGDTDSSIAGTALLGLSHLSQEGWPGLDQNRIGQAALKLAGDGSVGELTKITAVQVCASLNITDALAVVLGAAQQTASEPLAISAVGALGVLGGPGQVPFLNQLLEGKDERLKPAAQQALNNILRRQQQIVAVSKPKI